jgi:hypothetical protein
MQIDTTASDNLPRFRVLSISPRSLEGLEAMLKQSKWGNSANCTGCRYQLEAVVANVRRSVAAGRLAR